MTDARRYAPATARNRDYILQVLQTYLLPEAFVLEIASGTGEHGVYICDQLPQITWQPTDINPDAIASIQAWREHSKCDRLLPPRTVDVQKPQWWTSLPQSNEEDSHIQAIVNINMIHIAPWATTEGLFEGASELLSQAGVMYLYGPFKRNGHHTAESNAQFDQVLQSRNPLWGIRNHEDIIALGEQHQIHHLKTLEMPANNLSVIFQKR